MLLQFGGARESPNFGGQQNLVPNLEFYNPMVLIIESLLSLLCMFHSFLGRSNKLLYPSHKPSVSLLLNPCTKYDIYGVDQLLTKSKLSWGEFCTCANLIIQIKLNLR